VAASRGLGSSVGAVLLLVLAAGLDDAPVLVSPDVDLAFAVGEGAGGELLDQALVVEAQALYLEVVMCEGRLTES
jgi:hypothetical protein